MKINKAENWWDFFSQKFETFKGYQNIIFNYNENLKGSLKWLL
jgi:hypothetical protein